MEKAQGAENSKHKPKSDARDDMTANSLEVTDENATIEKEADKQANFDVVATVDELERIEKVADADENIKVEADVEVSVGKVAFCFLL